MEYKPKHIDFVWNSNRIDYNTIDPQTLTREICERAAKGDETTPVEIRDHFKALELTYKLARDGSDRPHISEIVKKIHGVLTKNILSEAESGKFRQWGIWIGNEMPPRHTLIPAYMDRLNRYADNAEDGSQMTWWLHREFECIHPFSDGNGRAGRLLLNYFYIRHFHEFEMVKYDEREDYYNGIREHRRERFVSIPESDPTPPIWHRDSPGLLRVDPGNIDPPPTRIP